MVRVGAYWQDSLWQGPAAGVSLISDAALVVAVSRHCISGWLHQCMHALQDVAAHVPVSAFLHHDACKHHMEMERAERGASHRWSRFGCMRCVVASLEPGWLLCSDARSACGCLHLSSLLRMCLRRLHAALVAASSRQCDPGSIPRACI